MKKLFLFLLLCSSAFAGKDDLEPVGTLVYTAGGPPPVMSGGEAVAGSVNTMVGMIGQHTPAPDFSHLHSQVAATELRIQTLDTQRVELERLFERYNTPQIIAEAKAVETRVQEFHSKTTSDRIALASDKWMIKKISIGNYGILSSDLNRELGTWSSFSANKKAVIDLADKYSIANQKLSTVSGEFRVYSEIAIQSGIQSLTQAAETEGSHRPGNFAENLGISESQLEIAKGLLDVGLSLTPGISLGKDAYEALTGKSLIDGSELDLTSRSFAVLGVATVGGSNIVKNSLKGLVKIAEVAHVRGLLGHGFHSAVKLSESGITDIVKHSPLPHHAGPLHVVPLRSPNGPMEFVSQSFRSETYYAYKTTEPMTLYRVAPSTIADEAVHHSSYWTRIKPTGGTQSMIDSALDLSWQNNATKWVEITVPAGETLFEGITASLPKLGHYTSEFVGGGNQVYINKFVPSAWVKQVNSF